MIEIFTTVFPGRVLAVSLLPILPEVIKFIAARHFRPMVRLVKLHPLLAQSYKCLQALSLALTFKA